MGGGMRLVEDDVLVIRGDGFIAAQFLADGFAVMLDVVNRRHGYPFLLLKINDQGGD